MVLVIVSRGSRYGKIGENYPVDFSGASLPASDIFSCCSEIKPELVILKAERCINPTVCFHLGNETKKYTLVNIVLMLFYGCVAVGCFRGGGLLVLAVGGAHLDTRGGGLDEIHLGGSANSSVL